MRETSIAIEYLWLLRMVHITVSRSNIAYDDVPPSWLRLLMKSIIKHHLKFPLKPSTNTTPEDTKCYGKLTNFRHETLLIACYFL